MVVSAEKGLSLIIFHPWVMYLCLMNAYTYAYPRPALTTDCVVLTTHSKSPKVLLIRRKHPPFEGFWTFPGGFVNMDEDLESAASRELKEETAISGIQLKQFKTYGNPLRDPRHRTVTVVFAAFVEKEIDTITADDAAEANWFALDSLPPLAFDHQAILSDLLLSLHLQTKEVSQPMAITRQ